MQLELFDWQTYDFSIAELTEDQRKPWNLKINYDQDHTVAINIEAVAPNGTKRFVWLEVQDGIFKVHCYDHEHDEPALTVFLDQDRTHICLGDIEEKIITVVRQDPNPIIFQSSEFKPERATP